MRNQRISRRVNNVALKLKTHKSMLRVMKTICSCVGEDVGMCVCVCVCLCVGQGSTVCPGYIEIA